MRFLSIALMCLAAQLIISPLVVWQHWVDNLVLGLGVVVFSVLAAVRDARVRWFAVALASIGFVFLLQPFVGPMEAWWDNAVFGGIAIIAAGYGAFKTQQ